MISPTTELLFCLAAEEKLGSDLSFGHIVIFVIIFIASSVIAGLAAYKRKVRSIREKTARQKDADNEKGG